MEKENLKELIIEHKDRFLARRDLLPRDIQQEIGRYLPQREIIILTGVRRCGKSSLLRLICDDLLNKKAVPARNILYLNFEDERFLPFTAQNFDLLYETFMEVENPQGRLFLFLDEIQNIKGWEKWLNRLYEFEDVKAFVTGSNATMLSSEISTALTGRNRQVVVWPFSFREVLRLRARRLYPARSRWNRNPGIRWGSQRLLTAPRMAIFMSWIGTTRVTTGTSFHLRRSSRICGRTARKRLRLRYGFR